MPADSEPRRAPAPFLFFLLILPYGTSFGFVSVAFAYLATHAAHPLTTEQTLGIVAAAFVPHTFKPLWAPLVDQTLTKKAWYLIALGLTIAGTVVVAAMPLSPERIPIITATIMISQVGLTLMGMCCEAFMGLGVPEEKKGKAAGWYNAGSNFGVGVGGGVALWLAQNLPSAWMSGAVLGLLMIACAIPLALFDEPLREHAHGLVASLRELGRNLGAIFTTRSGILGMILCLSPISAGASSNLFSSASDRWLVSANTVALVTGIIGGLVMAVGSLLGGFLADRFPRKLLYVCSGGLMALTAIALALSPHTPPVFVVLTLVYSFFFGISYAAFSAFVLETIGKGAVATKYNLFAAAMNGAVSYMTVIVGHADTKYGVTRALLTDAGCTLASLAIVLILMATVLRATKPAVDP
jgi:PAT family beta-lactamase induction signal transducer AmpG